MIVCVLFLSTCKLTLLVLFESRADSCTLSTPAVHMLVGFVLSFRVCVRVVASDLPHCPLLVGDRFVDVAVGDQMAN